MRRAGALARGKTSSEIRDDFERIASVSAPANDPSQPYDRMLVALIPPNCRRVLELGCGTGRLTDAIAQRAVEVTAVDFSPEMLRVARTRCAARANISFMEADILRLPAGLGPFDCVISVNLLHHLPVDQAAAMMKALVAPGGLLIVHDVRRSAGALDRALDVLRVAVKIPWRLGSASRVRTYFRQRAAWARHADGDVIPTAEEITEIRDSHFPGAEVRQHFLWRYTLLFAREAAAHRGQVSVPPFTGASPRPDPRRGGMET
jgi:SAM-dependent methyltransferase